MKTYKTIWCLLFSFLSSFALYAQNEASTGYSKATHEPASRGINILSDSLQAIIGSSEYCMGDAAIVPVSVDKFQSVAEFQLKLSYNSDILWCEGYINVHPLFANNMSCWIDQVADIITLQWQGDPPVTFDVETKVLDLVFTPKAAGLGQLHWLTGATESYFNNSDGNPIPARFQDGEAIIHDPPEIILEESRTVCSGETVTILGIATSTNPPVNYLWTYPDGSIHTEDPYFASIIQADSGIYTLLATDRIGCTDQKSIHLEVSCQEIAENNASGIVIYPNPGSGLFWVRISGSEDKTADVKVTDAAGTVVYQKDEVAFPAAGQISINLSDFSDGLYFLRISTKDSALHEKLILRHN